MEEPITCYICYDEVEEIIVLCKCKTTHAHVECVQKYSEMHNRLCCQMCQYRYNIQYRIRYLDIDVTWIHMYFTSSKIPAIIQEYVDIGTKPSTLARYVLILGVYTVIHSKCSLHPYVMYGLELIILVWILAVGILAVLIACHTAIHCIADCGPYAVRILCTTSFMPVKT
jgi:hypothetical protein